MRISKFGIKYFAFAALTALSAMFFGCSSKGASDAAPADAFIRAGANQPAAIPEAAKIAAAEYVPFFTIASIISTDDGKYAYIRADMSGSSKITGYAEKGVQFAVTEQNGSWYRVVFGDRVGFIEAKNLETDPQPGPLPQQNICAYSPPVEKGSVKASYKGTIKISASSSQAGGVELNFCTEDGTLIAKNASIIITDGTIKALSPDGETYEAAIIGGKATSLRGFSLKSIVYDASAEFGAVACKDGTELESVGDLFNSAELNITEATIYSAYSRIELSRDCYTVNKYGDNLVDVSRYSDDIVIDMLFSRDGNLLGERVWKYDTCLLQAGTLEKLLKAQAKFKKDGYSIVLYDAYRPYSITVKLYKKYRNTKYVAPPGGGSMHNRGVAVDMSLVDSNGIPLEMPSTVHTLNSSSNRNSTSMSAKARENMNYMTEVMLSCGFSGINSEWWHFADTEYARYPQTDYDLDDIPRLIYR